MAVGADWRRWNAAWDLGVGCWVRVFLVTSIQWVSAAGATGVVVSGSAGIGVCLALPRRRWGKETRSYGPGGFAFDG